MATSSYSFKAVSGRRFSIQTILTIAGFDPSSGAGITADLAVIAAHGIFGISAITALTVQSTVGVQATHFVEAAILTQTLQCLMEDLPPTAVKIGMLGTSDNTEAIVDFLRQHPQVPVVLDPVFRSSSGRELLSPEGIALVKSELLPLVDWVTPNTQELCLLADIDVGNSEGMEAAVATLRGKYPGLNIVATGGHLDSADDLVALADGRSEWLRGEKIASRATHGTGCAFSTALACGLAAGLDGITASKGAKNFVAEAIRRSQPMGRGNGPMSLLWPLLKPKQEQTTAKYSGSSLRSE